MILTHALTVLLQTADDLAKVLTIEGITVAGSLLAFCVFLGWQNHKKDRLINKKDDEIKEVNEKRINEKIEMITRIEEIAKSGHGTLTNVIDFVKGYNGK